MAHKIPGVEVGPIEIGVAQESNVIQIVQESFIGDEPDRIEVDRVRAELLIKALRDLLDATPSLF